MLIVVRLVCRWCQVCCSISCLVSRVHSLRWDWSDSVFAAWNSPVTLVVSGSVLLYCQNLEAKKQNKDKQTEKKSNTRPPTETCGAMWQKTTDGWHFPLWWGWNKGWTSALPVACWREQQIKSFVMLWCVGARSTNTNMLQSQKISQLNCKFIICVSPYVLWFVFVFFFAVLYVIRYVLKSQCIELSGPP